ncbi:MAG TPA: hypothetical protein VK716_13230 [Terracidiphilus sp.]|jgi:hypothetical protein|nr:hypothetical protein [Terracidiphilus sp.]
MKRTIPYLTAACMLALTLATSHKVVAVSPGTHIKKIVIIIRDPPPPPPPTASDVLTVVLSLASSFLL